MSQTYVKKYLSRLMALLMVAVLLFSFVPTASASEGSCGANLSWNYSNGTLTITGSGDMTDFVDGTFAPWYGYRGEITRVVLPEGLTSIGDLAFYQCDRLTRVTLPGGVKRVGDYSFAGCTSLAVAVLPEGLESIGRSAFECCEGLVSLRLPSTLKTMKFQAFYRCAGLTSVVIPASVTDLGMTVFGYCTSLVRAELLAPITMVPEWLFYGCVNLTTVVLPETVTGVDTYAFKGCDSLSCVEYEGPIDLVEFIQGDIYRDDPDSDAIVTTVGGSGTDTNNRVTEEKGDGSYTSQTTTAVQTPGATVGTVTTDTYPADGTPGETSTRVDATVEGNSGWDAVTDAVQEGVKHHNNRTENGSTAGSVEVNVYLTGDSALTQDVLEQFAGQSVKLNIYAQDGSSWTIDCSRYSAGTVEGAVDLSYLLSNAEQSVLDELGCTAAYLLKFNSDAEVNAQVAVQLPVGHARQTATLYQRMGGKAEKLQSVIVDDRGLANFWLAKVDADMEYLIGLTIPAAEDRETIVPDSLKTVYGIDVEDSYPKYVITGRTSSWNMTFGQVAGILAAVMVGAVVVVGVVMFTLNKRKLKNGCVPEWDEEDVE